MMEMRVGGGVGWIDNAGAYHLTRAMRANGAEGMRRFPQARRIVTKLEEFQISPPDIGLGELIGAKICPQF